MCYFHDIKLFLPCLRILGSFSKMREPNEDTQTLFAGDWEKLWLSAQELPTCPEANCYFYQHTSWSLVSINHTLLHNILQVFVFVFSS